MDGRGRVTVPTSPHQPWRLVYVGVFGLCFQMEGRVMQLKESLRLLRWLLWESWAPSRHLINVSTFPFPSFCPYHFLPQPLC